MPDFQKEGKLCCFCKIDHPSSEQEELLGPICFNQKSRKKENYAHLLCAIYSSEVWLDQSIRLEEDCDIYRSLFYSPKREYDYSGDFYKKLLPYINMISEACSRSCRIRCRECKSSGASLGCSKKMCPNSFHIQCALKSDKYSLFMASMALLEVPESWENKVSSIFKPLLSFG